MNAITVQDIQADPTAFLRRVEAGESLVVMRDERAVAEVRPMVIPPPGLRPHGLAAGQFRLPDDFDDPLPKEVLDAFEGL